MKTLALSLLLLSAVAAQEGAQGPKPGREHELLKQFEGTCDEKGRVFTSVMEGADPATGKTMKMKTVSEIKDKDTKVMALSMVGPDGKDFPLGTIEYKRRK